MRRRNRTAVRSALAVAAVVAVLVPGTPRVPAVAAAVTGDAVDPAVASLAAMYGLSHAEADARIAWQNHAVDVQEAVAARLGDSFGGMWISQADGGRIKVGVVGDRPSATAAHGTLDQVGLVAVTDVVPVRYSMRELHAARDIAIEHLRRFRLDQPTAPMDAGIDVSENRVTVSLPPSQFASPAFTGMADGLARALGDKVAVDFTAAPVQGTACDFPFCDPPLRAGVEIGNRAGTCTAGFPARSRSDNALYIITAGHCGIQNPENIWRSFFSDHRTWQEIGHTLQHRRQFGEVGDFQIIRVEQPAAWRTMAWVFVADGPHTTRDTEYEITSDGNAMEDQWVCMAGKRSGTQCGQVGYLDRCRWYDEPLIREICHLTIAGYPSAKGDSGAPIFSRGKAFGIHSGKNRFTDNAYFLPIRYAENQLNVDISFDRV